MAHRKSHQHLFITLLCIEKPFPSSAFEKAVAYHNGNDFERSEVDMEDFKDDYVFSKAQLLLLERSLKDYQTRAALNDMKKYDGLGRKAEPIRLVFLKFLIETNSFQGLFNIQAVIGKKFWVINDIDKKVQPQFIELFFNESRSRWGIAIIKKGHRSKR